ncbi:hypothetical protein [Citricoccus sp. SGAir0253]|uniref:hypothetical protein n=1 Tax=Citricoccus sp. SGAir0253 TaxID=2567881 RepID=UPI00143CD8AE|nr:hypothetical protein [Citricoccus sp. SGAir0253]
MSAFLPSFAPVSRTGLSGATSETTAFWTITGVVGLTALAGAAEVLLHVMG